jgi:hypothetical protein
VIELLCWRCRKGLEMAPQNFDIVENASFLLDACSREFNTERVFSRRDLSERRKGGGFI